MELFVSLQRKRSGPSVVSLHRKRSGYLLRNVFPFFFSDDPTLTALNHGGLSMHHSGT